MELPKLTKEVADKVDKLVDYESKFIGQPLKVIFLDIDGVMNSASGTGPYLADMEQYKLSLLKNVMDEELIYGIVLTSDRRFSDVYIKQFEEALDKYEIFMIDMLRRPKDIFDGPNDNRGKQIRDYLDIATDIDKFVILDDMDDGISELFPKEYVQVNRFYGLNDDACKRMKEIMK